MKAAIYARVSSARQKEEQTIASQTVALQEYATAAGFEVPAEWVFEDEGFSGATLVRPALERLRDLVAEIEIGVVLCYSPDRLARRYAYQALLIEEFSRCGTEVRFLKGRKAETPEDELLIQFQGMIAEYERAQIAERTRRGKLHRARGGSVAVLSGAPYGYRYVRKSEAGDAHYEIVESQAAVVRELFRRYVEEQESIGSLGRWASWRGLPSATGKAVWDRSVIWAILRNPAYCGRAAYGKTRRCEQRPRINRILRLRGQRVARRPARRERPQDQWTEIAVPAIISGQTFELAARRLQENKHFASRRTKEPSLLQGLVVCRNCSYSYYRTSTRTKRGKLYYYRCLGSDNYRFEHGRVCHNRPVRQDYLDEVVWQHVISLLADPALIRSELDRRLRELSATSPGVVETVRLETELHRVRTAMDRLLDAYQNELLALDELRSRMPDLRRRQSTIRSELAALKERTLDREQYLKLAETLESFLTRLHQAADCAPLEERQRLVRLLLKEVLVGPERIVIRHSIPVTARDPTPGYRLRWGRHFPAAGKPLPALVRQGISRAGWTGAMGKGEVGALRR
jgi:site-specific DNA recombinase